MRDKLVAYRLVLAPLGMGAACFLVVATLIDARADEGAVWFAWLTSTTVAAALAGWLRPVHWLRSGGLIMLAQSPCMFVATALSGEISKPGGPMGGLVAVFIGSTLLLFWTPVPLLAAGLSARARRRKLQPASRSGAVDEVVAGLEQDDWRGGGLTVDAEALREPLVRLLAALTAAGEVDGAERVRQALGGSEGELIEFVGSNELWGGAGSIADPAGIDRDRACRQQIESALIELGNVQLAKAMANPRTRMWVEAFESWRKAVE